jgi:hypothetical protein
MFHQGLGLSEMPSWLKALVPEDVTGVLVVPQDNLIVRIDFTTPTRDGVVVQEFSKEDWPPELPRASCASGTVFVSAEPD